MSKSSLLARGLTLYAALAAVAAAVLAPAARAAAPIPQPPPVTARAYILGDYHSGRVLAADHAYDRMEPASLTKLMTSYVVFKALKEGRLKLTESVTISEHAWRSEGSRTFVQVGTQIPAEVLIKGMIVQSGNDATIALAERVGGTEDGFAQIMNEYAKQLGLTGSHFANSDGLPNPEHYTTARDMFVIAQALIRDFPEYYPIYATKEFRYNNISQPNRNRLLGTDPTVDGVKSGHTEAAGWCLIASAKHGERRLVAVVLGAKSDAARAQEAERLLNWGFAAFDTVQLYQPGKPLATLRVWKGAQREVKAGFLADRYLTLPKGKADKLALTAQAQEPLIAPIASAQTLGTVKVSLEGKPIAEFPLIALEEVPEGNFFSRTWDTVRLRFEKK